MLPADPETGRAERRATPLVEVARPEIRVDGCEIDVDHPRRVGTVHQRQDASAPELHDQSLDREAQPGR